VELIFQFEGVEELTQKLDETSRIWELLDSKLPSDTLKVPREVKPRLFGICRFLDKGQLEFTTTPKSATHGVALTAYAYDPEGLTMSQYQLYVKIDNASPYLTGESYREYYIRDGDKYSISLKGKKWVEEEILPDYKQLQQGEGPSSLGSKK
jgi:hypothetical protein